VLDEPAVSAVGRPPIPWALRSRGRLLMSLLAAGLGGLATAVLSQIFTVAEKGPGR